MGQFSTGLCWAGVGDTEGTNPAANSQGMSVLLWFPSPTGTKPGEFHLEAKALLISPRLMSDKEFLSFLTK